MASIVVLCFFPAFTPPSSGGEMRLSNLYRALSRTHDITLLTSTDFGARFEEIVHSPRLRELRFPKDDLWRSAYATLERSGIHGELSGLAFALAVSDPTCKLRDRARRLALTAQFVIHEFPYSEPIFADGCPCPEIYNSHNFEASLLASIVRGDGFEDALLRLIRLESMLIARAQRVFATSEVDAEKFRIFYGAEASKFSICPNGLDDSELEPVARERMQRRGRVEAIPRLLFLGSAHYPNIEAAHFLIRLADELEDCEIVLAGGLCAALSGIKLPSNLTVVGRVDPFEKQQLLSDVDLYLNPVVIGSGTSLKALEALRAGIPMISTPEGVRGLDLQAGVHCEIVNRTMFAAAVKRLLHDAATRERVAAEGLAFVRGRLSWDAIAEALTIQMSDSSSIPRASRPLVLVLNDYAVLQGGSGGIARVRNLSMRLGADVLLVSFGSSCEIEMLAPRVLHMTVPKMAAHLAFEDAVKAGQPMSANDAVASLFVGSSRTIRETVCRVAQRASAVVFEHPYMAPLLDAITEVRPELPIIYSAHNVEATHKAAILRGHRLAGRLTQYIASLERCLIGRADLVVCCTEADAAQFSGLVPKILVVPNGCTMPEKVSLTRGVRGMAGAAPRRIGFLASSHGPNAEGAQLIVRDLASKFPEELFEFIGSVCGTIKPPYPDNIRLYGMLSDSSKTQIISEWDIGLNPILSGGGSSLKLPDYMAHGLATLSTPAGARGFAVEDNDIGVVAEWRYFPDALHKMLDDDAMLTRQGVNARRYASEKLDWNVITADYRNLLSTMLVPPAVDSRRERVLVVTYRYTEPPLGGAEEYLIEILKRMRPRLAKLDLAAVDINQLTNHHHFGCRFASQEGGAANRLGAVFDRMLFFKPDQLEEDEALLLSRDLERAWAREERSLLAPFSRYLAAAGRLRLFSGFYWPEPSGNVTRRWTSPEFSLLVPLLTRSMHLAGYASTQKILRMTLIQLAPDGTTDILARHQENISPNFDFHFSLPKIPGNLPLILCCEVDEHHVPGDHRPFGVLLESAFALLNRADAPGNEHECIGALDVSAADLAAQNDETLRADQFGGWVAALYETAHRRDAAIDKAFAAVRGPHSRALQTWLAAHAFEYDSVLVQGIPFDVIPSTVETLACLHPRPRLVALPHFHGDDRFYHWKRYFNSFEAADATLIFSSALAEHLGSRANIVVVPGGGVRADEHCDPDAERCFRAIHKGTSPYFLVLGRKTPSKGYDRVIKIHQGLRQSGIDVDLILIGVDEDGHTIDESGVHYLGHQPRPVIRGALSSCLGLVSMSRSESFGIVLCEAWLFGKPVIANRACYAFRELVRHCENGMLVTTNAELGAAMRQLAAHSKERDRLGQAGFEEVVSRFTWEKVAEACYGALSNREVSDSRTVSLQAGGTTPMPSSGMGAASSTGTKVAEA